ncbi:MAG: NADP oxidoreductase, partial [Microterricola sp.]
LERFNGAVVVDATNYWEPVDGTPAILDGAGILSTSEVVQRRHPGLRLVKSLNHLGYHDMDTDAAPVGATGRRAVAVAGDDAEAGGLVGAFLDRIGFDPVHIGTLADGAILQPGEELFGRFVQRAELLAVAAGQGELAA